MTLFYEIVSNCILQLPSDVARLRTKIARILNLPAQNRVVHVGSKYVNVIPMFAKYVIQDIFLCISIRNTVDILQLRLDFNSFVIAGPSTITDSVTKTLIGSVSISK